MCTLQPLTYRLQRQLTLYKNNNAILLTIHIMFIEYLINSSNCCYIVNKFIVSFIVYCYAFMHHGFSIITIILSHFEWEVIKNFRRVKVIHIITSTFLFLFSTLYLYKCIL